MSTTNGHGSHASVTGVRPPAPASPAAMSTDATPLAAGAVYRAWGWPVTIRHDRVWLESDIVARIIPVLLATEVAAILTRRHCPAPVLAHPYATEHQILLAGERFGVALPWPPDVRQVTGTLLLPPTFTPRGPVTRVRPPEPDALRLCREIDVLAAVRTALSDPPSSP